MTIPSQMMLQLGAQHFPKALLPEGGRTALKRLGKAAHGSSLILYECRLRGKNGAQVDISTRYDRIKAGPQKLRDLCEKMRSQPDAPDDYWYILDKFAQSWDTHPDISEIETLYLEYDCNAFGHADTPPAIFFVMENGLTASPAATFKCLTAFADVTPERQRIMSRLFEFADQYRLVVEKILGLMLSRDGEFRLMFRARGKDELTGFLRDINWPGDIQACITHWESIFCVREHVRIVLGVSQNEIHPDYGFEIFTFSDDSANDFLDWLTTSYPQTLARCLALSEWSGLAGVYIGNQVVPEFVAQARNIDVLSTRPAFTKNINHFKLNFSHSGLSAAKVYLAISEFDSET